MRSRAILQFVRKTEEIAETIYAVKRKTRVRKENQSKKAPENKRDKPKNRMLEKGKFQKQDLR